MEGTLIISLRIWITWIIEAVIIITCIAAHRSIKDYQYLVGIAVSTVTAALTLTYVLFVAEDLKQTKEDAANALLPILVGGNTVYKENSDTNRLRYGHCEVGKQYCILKNIGEGAALDIK
jgi:hypothetical protein